MSRESPFSAALIFPPQWIPLNPHFALMKLAGHLRSLDVKVELHDLSVKFYRHILTPKYLRYIRTRCTKMLPIMKAEAFVAAQRGDSSAAAESNAARLLEIESSLNERAERWDHVINSIESAMSVFDERERFFNPLELVKAFVVVDQALELASLPTYPFCLKFNDYQTPGCPLTMESLLGVTVDRERNMFLPFHEHQATRILAGSPDLVGISINSHSQVIPGLTLARILKQRAKDKDLHVTLGGNYFVRVQEALLNRSEFLSTFADSVVVGEGEEALTALVSALRTGAALHDVPGLVYLNVEGQPTLSTPARAYPMAQDILPSLDGIQLNDYFCPDTVLSLRSSKGCYWQKCTFCDTDYGICPETKSLEQISAEVAHLNKRYGVENFCFIDECMRPRYMESLCRHLRERECKVHWYGNGRTEPSFTRERLERLCEGGLTMLMWGLESGSDRVMALINKGIPLEGRLEVLRHADQAGLWNFAYIFFGFPSETDEEAMETIRMISDNRDIIHSYGRSIFTLGKHTSLRNEAADLGIVERMTDKEEFSTRLHYTTQWGHENKAAIDRANLCKTVCSKAYEEPLWMYLRYRELIHLYLKEHGKEFVQNFRFTPAQRAEINILFAAPEQSELLAALTADTP